jgi:hypothetical protein
VLKREFCVERRSVLALAALCVLLVVSRASAAPLAPDYTQVGVKVGDTTIYRVSNEVEPANKSRIVVHEIVGPVVTLNFTLYLPDGSVIMHEQQPTDLRTGSGITYFLLAANLAAGDPMYSTPHSMTINDTVLMLVGGALRAVNHARYPAAGLEGYWDRLTGVCTQLHRSGAWWVNYTLLSTTAWAPDAVPSLLTTTVIALIAGIVIIVPVIALMVLRTRPRKR